ncbi:hypothetical protein COEREDRAFT_97490 [Coemansia reversa NRRL 1564]|uniref:Uncharacterized protein n=1 Tax=Coemansia reversa (strain ATCC 12441 / NRRL 1564) TaxID=763665 RepID=A0A2G5BBD2_COERN|nr:hypothetical protein COEREDRAFT_97490 [Coemansia reversa NRRL 1564]|eukprot:PIA16302.1 hypothetical protein COEREDRAFT_97490 [Coemansia reversa NRRL 1564]
MFFIIYHLKKKNQELVLSTRTTWWYHQSPCWVPCGCGTHLLALERQLVRSGQKAEPPFQTTSTCSPLPPMQTSSFGTTTGRPLRASTAQAAASAPWSPPRTVPSAITAKRDPTPRCWQRHTAGCFYATATLFNAQCPKERQKKSACTCVLNQPPCSAKAGAGWLAANGGLESAPRKWVEKVGRDTSIGRGRASNLPQAAEVPTDAE